MRKFFIYITCFIIIFLLYGCKTISTDINEKIITPENNNLIIKGAWKIENLKKTPALTVPKLDVQYTDRLAVFDTSFAIFDDDVCINPQYKIKRVNAKSYLLYNYKITAAELGISSKLLNVLSISDAEKTFYDFLMINSDELLTIIDNTAYKLTKLNSPSKETNFEEILTEKSNEVVVEASSKDSIYSGVLLGLRTSSSEINNNITTYRTLWISSNNKKLNPIVSISDLFVPRQKGFWNIGVGTENRSSSSIDYIFAYPLSSGESSSQLHYIYPKLTENINQQILFVGNDYIAIEYNRLLNDKHITPPRIQVLPIDSLHYRKGIKISDVSGERGAVAMKNAAANALNSLPLSSRTLKITPDEESFAIVRNNGHWIFKGRLYSEEFGEAETLDFNINLLPPSSMIYYDKLHVTWNRVKAKVPDAVDVFTSPNKDIALIITKNFVNIYTLSNGKFSDRPIGRVRLNENETVVMAEWSTGEFVERWNREISK
jgi:hypothetical protein